MATISGSKRLLNISSDAMAASNSMTYGGLNVATEQYVSTQIANLVSSAPGALDTLNELAAALGDDPNFATTMTNALAGKLNTSHDMTLTLNGDASGSATFTNMGNATLTVTVANDSHTHDGRYYTETEVNNLLAGKLSTTAKAADSNLLDGLDSSRFLYTSSSIFSGDWNTLTDSDYEIQLREVHNITNGAHSNYPEGVYTYGSVLAWQLASGTFALYASHTGDLVFQTGWNNDGYSGWRQIWHTGNFNPASYLTTSGKAADSNLLDGINSSSFLRSDANDTASGAYTFSGQVTFTNNVVITEAAPTISFLDTDSTDDFYIHVNSNNFYVLRNTTNAENIVDGGWDTPHPLSLEGDTNTAYVFGSQLNISNWDTAHGWGNHASAGYLTSLPSHNHDSRYYTESESDSRFAGRGFINSAYVEFTVGGDPDTFYPVRVGGGGAYAFQMYSFSRRYNWAAPDTWNTASHRGGLTLTIQWSGDTGWGGNDKALRVIQFDETYSTVAGGMTLPTSGGLLVWLRGGGAVYHCHSPRGVEAAVTVDLEGYEASNGTRYEPRSIAEAQAGQSSITDNWPVRDYNQLYDTGNRVASQSWVGAQNYLVQGGTQNPGSWTASTRFKSSGQIADSDSGSHSLQVISDNGNDAFMAFHISADYAVFFGLDGASNRLHTGGWSAGANQYMLWDTRDFSSTNITNWNTAYDNYITGISVTGTTTKTITLTQRDGGTISDTFTDLSGAGGDGNDFLVNGGFDPGTEVLSLEVANQGIIEIPLPGVMTDTDTNTWRGIHDTPVNGATTTSISSNWAFDNVKTPVPSGAVFTDNNTTYSAGTGLTLTGTEFSVTAGTYAAASHNHTSLNLTGSIYNGNANYSIDLRDHSDRTWLRNQVGGWTFQSGSSGDDWTQSFTFYLPAAGTTANNVWAELGQRDSNDAAAGRYRGLRIVKDTGGVVDGDLRAGAIYIGSARRDAQWTSAYNWGNHASAGYASNTDLGNLNDRVDDITLASLGLSESVLVDYLGITMARHLGWVPAYGSSVETNVKYVDQEEAVRIGNATDTTIGAAYKAVRVKEGDRVRFTVMAKASSAISSGFYLRLYQYDGNLPDGKTHVSHNAGSSSTLVQEDSRGDTGWVENSSLSTDWTTYEKTYIAPADGYVSLVALNWDGAGAFVIYLSQPDIQFETNDSFVDASVSNDTITFTRRSGGTVAVTTSDANTWRGIDDTPVNGATAESISSNWAYDNVRLFSNGGQNIAGSFTATGDITAFSDIRVKKNIKDLEGSLGKVTQLRGVEYNKIGSEEKSIGVIAQEIQEVLPEVVKEGEDGMLSVAYGNITAVLIEAIKEQQEIIAQLEERIVDLENRM